MVKQNELEGTPMYEALQDLAERMDRKHIAPVELNVIGGFALMLHGVRPADGVTDIDYVGDRLSDDLNQIIEDVGRAHNMEPGWINKDGMATGMAMEDFELSTGELHFIPAVKIGDISINVLEERDLLRLKIIAVDTAMTELEATGEFARVKDFHDIHLLMEDLDMGPEEAAEEYGDYMICWPDTEDLLYAIANAGPDGGLSVIENKKQEFEDIKSGRCSPNPFRSFSVDDLDAMLDSIQR